MNTTIAPLNSSTLHLMSLPLILQKSTTHPIFSANRCLPSTSHLLSPQEETPYRFDLSSISHLLSNRPQLRRRCFLSCPPLQLPHQGPASITSPLVMRPASEALGNASRVFFFISSDNHKITAYHVGSLTRCTTRYHHE